jgi:hypothetical protein
MPAPTLTIGTEEPLSGDLGTAGCAANAIDARSSRMMGQKLTLARMQMSDFTRAERQIVIDAYSKADAAGRSVADCYVAGVDALQRLCPGLARHVVATEAVRILTTDTSLVDLARRHG